MWGLLVDVLMCLNCVRHIELDHYEINYSINNCHLNNKPHNFYFHRLSILRGLWTWSWNVGCFDISGVRSNLTVKTSVYWVTTRSVERTHILKSCFLILLHQGTFSLLCSRIQGYLLSLMNKVDPCVASATCFVWNAKPVFPTA